MPSSTKLFICLLQACYRPDKLDIRIKCVLALRCPPGQYTKPQRHQQLQATSRTKHNLVQKMHFSSNYIMHWLHTEVNIEKHILLKTTRQPTCLSFKSRMNLRWTPWTRFLCDIAIEFNTPYANSRRHLASPRYGLVKNPKGRIFLVIHYISPRECKPWPTTWEICRQKFVPENTQTLKITHIRL